MEDSLSRVVNDAEDFFDKLIPACSILFFICLGLAVAIKVFWLLGVLLIGVGVLIGVIS